MEEVEMAQPFVTACDCKSLVLFQPLLPCFLLIAFIFFFTKMIRRTSVENLKAVPYHERLMRVPYCFLDL